MRAEIVCWDGPGPVPERFQQMLASGAWDCAGCTPQVHIHTGQEITVVEGALLSLFDVMVGHPEGCPVAIEEQRRAAGAAGLN